MNLDKHQMSKSSSELMLLIHERLKIGCYCVDNEQEFRFRTVLEDVIKRFLSLDFQDINDDDCNFLLVCCSLLEGLCCLSINQLSSGYICPSLRDLINLLRSSQVTNHLIPFVNYGNRHVCFASTKALIGMVKAECTSSGNALCVQQFCKEWTSGLLHIDKTLVHRISFIEHLFLAFKNFCNETMLPCSNQMCVKEVAHCSTEQFNEILVCSILQSSMSIPNLIESILSWHDNDFKIHSIHGILRLLTMVFEKPSAIKEAFLQDASSLIALLTSLMPSLVWERTCNLLQDILDYQSTISDKSESSEYKFILASKFLHLDSGKLWRNMPHDDGLHSFIGPFIMENIKPLNLEFHASVDKSLLQSFLLCNLACLAIVSSRVQSDIEEMRDKGIIAIQECIQIKIYSHQQSGRAPLDDPPCFCVPALQLFDDQDDGLVKALLYFLEISQYIKKQDLMKGFANQIHRELWNPHFQFYVFLLLVKMDYEVLLDLLISEETNFLLYFLKYLKLIVSDWDFLVVSHKLMPLYKFSLFEGETIHFKRPPHLACNELSPNLESSIKDEVKTEKLVDYELSSEDSEEEEHLPILVKRHLKEEKPDSFVESANAKLEPKNTLLEVILVLNSLLKTIEKQIDKNLFPYNAKPLVKLLKEIKIYFS